DYYCYSSDSSANHVF
nr:immunoglobulin light chain junction region [Macaca mulatta]MOW30500.1 immunoglobulin light chain junction region [Macaca mulatta]